jgi:endonuclease I
VCGWWIANGCGGSTGPADAGEDGTAQDGDAVATDDGGGLPDCKAEPPTGQHPWDDLYQGMAGLQGDALRQQLVGLVSAHQSLGYDGAREEIFSDLDNVGGRVQCVYTGEWVTTQGIPPIEVMNVEQTWPQSLGADTEPARSDLHHLFPAIAIANEQRGNHPYGIVVNPRWERGGSVMGGDATMHLVFQPREAHRGDAARALFYFAVRYGMNVDATQEGILRVWSCLDPPDAKEAVRNDGIETLQGNRNPFVDHPEFVDRITDF